MLDMQLTSTSVRCYGCSTYPRGLDDRRRNHPVSVRVCRNRDLPETLPGTRRPSGRPDVSRRTAPRRPRRQPGRARTGVVDAVGARRRAALLGRQRLPRRHPAGGDQEAGVADHLVARADREPLDVPVAHQRLPGLRLGEPAVRAQRLDGPAELGGGGDVGADEAARGRAPRPPRRRTPTARACRGRPGRRAGSSSQRLGEVADGELPGRVLAAEELVDVAARRRRRTPRGARTTTRGRAARRRAAASRSAHRSRRPASTTRAPGKMSAIATIWAASLG